MPATIINITQEMIDAVFGSQNLRKKFVDPKMAKRNCELRLTGASYAEIGKKCKRSADYCRRNVEKLVWVYQLFCKEEQT